MILALSDVHLGYEKCDREPFKHFVENRLAKLKRTDQLVLIGDILDFWRRQNVEASLENEDILSSLASLKADVYYLPGNHDYSIHRFSQMHPDKYPFRVSKAIRLQDGGKKFYFTHGYELEVLARLEPLTIDQYESLSDSMCQMTDAFLGKLLSSLWRVFRPGLRLVRRTRAEIESVKHPPEERMTKVHMDRIAELATSGTRGIFLGVASDEVLVFGHTHRPFESEKALNTGSWVKTSQDHNTYIEIVDGTARLLRYSM